MKKITLLALLALTLFACQKKPAEKAQMLVKQWMNENMPEATFTPSSYISAVEYTTAELAEIDSLYASIKEARTYDVISFDRTKIHDAFNQRSEMLDELENKLQDIAKANAQAKQQAIYQKIEDLRQRNKPKVIGEKGYKITVKYKDKTESGSIIFYVNTEITAITEVDK